VIHHHLIDDRPDESLYSNGYTRYPGRPDIHLMFPAIYHQGSDTTYGQLAVSMDGVHWSRFTRQAIIPHGEPGEPDEAMVYPEPELIRFPEEGKFRLLCHCGNKYHIRCDHRCRALPASSRLHCRPGGNDRNETGIGRAGVCRRVGRDGGDALKLRCQGQELLIGADAGYLGSRWNAEAPRRGT